MTLLSDQFREVAASLRPDAETLRLQRRAPAKVIKLPEPQQGRNDSGYGYGRTCPRCAGTDSGDSPRGWVGKCGCGVLR